MALTQVSSGMLGTTGVSAGTYGGSSAIPVLTVNAEGQVTSASNVSVSSTCLLYTSPSPRDRTRSRMPSSA